jgi:hypothetical protein
MVAVRPDIRAAAATPVRLPWWRASRSGPRARWSMALAFALAAATGRAAVAQPVPTVPFRAGMVITRSVRLAPGTYRVPGRAGDDAALITIRGEGITVDARGVVLVGLPPESAPDGAAGVAVRIDGGRAVTLRGLTARGYRVGILAEGTRGLVLEDNDLSHGWKPRLFSLVEHESLADWLSFHRNEQDEWRRFGAAMYLRDVTGGTIRGNRAVQGMNGLLLVRTDSLRIERNDVTHNSGLGLGLYRSSHNVIVANHLDYNVRGYSHGVYRRGQDSAGLLLYEQSAHNVVAWNSVTHGGDGLFLWAGQSTMDTGQGGANDNLFAMNDFSWAPTNGMEATFSRNAFIANRVVGNDHGLWGGYSWQSLVAGNCFAGNRIAIAIEHGQENALLANRFDGDSLAIRLWANPVEPSDWGYPKRRDTRSRDVRIAGNLLVGTRIAYRIDSTSGLDSAGNRQQDAAGSAFVAPAPASGVPPAFCDAGVPLPDTARALLGARLPAEAPSFAQRADAVRDRSAIVVDEWGPYDWRSPKLWPVDSTRASPLRLRVLGPPGTWRVRSRRGVARLSAEAGEVGDTLVVTPAAPPAGMAADWVVVLEYRGAATVSPRGTPRAAGVPVSFSYARWEPAQDWRVRVVAWSDSTDPRRQAAAFARLLAGAPLLERREPRLDWMWYRPPIAGIPPTRWAMEATTTVRLPPGRHTLRTLSDDAVRVWVDDRLVIDHWAPHETAPAYATITGGRRRLRVQYAQVEGWTELRLDLLRGVQPASSGSPGPH